MIKIEYKLIKYVKELNENSAKSEVTKMLNNNISPKEIQEQLFIGMKEIGLMYESGEYFIGDLIVSGMMIKEILALDEMKYQLSTSNDKKYIGKVILGTVSEDIHDIGKNIIFEMLEAEGFQVLDLGVDVSPEKFVEAIISFEPDIVGISCLLATCIDSIFTTIKKIEKHNLRDNVKIIVGGTINKKYINMDTADALTNDAYEGLKICKTWVTEKYFNGRN